MTILFVSCNNKTGEVTPTNPFIETPTENNNPNNNDNQNEQTQNNNQNDNKTEVVSYLEGTEAAKMLLAQNRLNPEVLSSSVSIFNGEQVFSNLAEKIKLSRKNKNLPEHEETRVNDTSVEWINVQKDDSNSMDYFNNISGNVEQSAKNSAEMIRNFKKNIRVANCWVVTPDSDYLLLVDENSETLINKHVDFVNVCRRYTDSNGMEVYESYSSNDIGQSRMKYIEGLLVEYFYQAHDGAFSHHFIADKKKGYWDVFGDLNDGYASTVIKDNIVYDYLASYGNEIPHNLDVVSNDRLNDIVTIEGGQFLLYGHVFEGIDKFVVNIDSQDQIKEYDDSNPAGTTASSKVTSFLGGYYPNNYNEVEIHLSNGNVIKADDKIGNVTYCGTHISLYAKSSIHDDGYHHIEAMRFNVEGETLEEQMENFKEFFENQVLTKLGKV